MPESTDLYTQSRTREEPSKVFGRDVTNNLLQRLESLCVGGGGADFVVTNYWHGELRWSRNRASMTSDRRDTSVHVRRTINGGSGVATTNQVDEESLTGAIRLAERHALRHGKRDPIEMAFDLPTFAKRASKTWSDATLARTTQQRAEFVKAVTEEAERNALVSAGYLEARGAEYGTLTIDPHGRKNSFYGRVTQAQCSATVRHPKGTGSGWAGLAHYDIDKIDEVALAKRALDKCISSLDAVRIEPGRYTTILEPQAVADLTSLLISQLGRGLPERIYDYKKVVTPFHLGYDEGVDRDRSKIGLRMIDERISISHDPSDPELGLIPIDDLNPVVWFKDGVLQALNYQRAYALNELAENESIMQRTSYRMSGGTTTIDEMIASTQRGLIVTRFSSIGIVDPASVLATGLTRDGLWLVENGKITKAVRNFRFTESPLFAFNNVVDLGVPTPVFNPSMDPQSIGAWPALALSQTIVPALKVNDFSFTSTIDAI